MIRKITIGFIITGDYVPAWYYETILSIAKETNNSICFLKFSLPDEGPSSYSIGYRLFTKFESYWFRPEYDAQKAVSIKEFIATHKTVNLKKDDYYELDNNSLNQLKDLGLDVIFSIQFKNEKSENVSTASKFGLWYIHFGYKNYNNSGAPAFWEVMDNSPVTGSYLLMRKNGTDFILYEGTTTSVPYSVKNNFNSIAWKSASYLGFRLATLGKLYDTFIHQYKTPLEVNSVKRILPYNYSMGLLFTKNVLGYLNYKLNRKISANKFTLLYAPKPFNFRRLQNIPFKKIKLPRNVFFADPFVVSLNNINYIFFEEYDLLKSKGHISVIEADENGMHSNPRMIIKKEYHLSYPFVFKLNDVFFMIPETSANKTVELYTAVSFPYEWKFVMNLMEGIALIDCTVVFQEGLWWLFANSAAHPAVSTNDQLFLYYSEDLFSGSWNPHPQNPIATHAENCRSAGRIFQDGGKLYRPAQNNASLQYGSGMKINEIIALTVNEYKEREVINVSPASMGLKAIHHIDFTSDLMVIDGIAK